MSETTATVPASKPSFLGLIRPNYRAIKSWGIMSSFAAGLQAVSTAWRGTVVEAA